MEGKENILEEPSVFNESQCMSTHQVEFITPLGPQKQDLKPEDIITPKKKMAEDLLDLLSKDAVEPEELSPKFLNAPKKSRSQEPSIKPDKAPSKKSPMRKMRQFNLKGQFQETLRTKNHILALLKSDNSSKN